MRIYSWTIWLFSALLVGTASADVTFDTEDFHGINGTAILFYNGTNTYMFAWSSNETGPSPTIESLVLADMDEKAIVTLRNPDESNNFLQGQLIRNGITTALPKMSQVKEILTAWQLTGLAVLAP